MTFIVECGSCGEHGKLVSICLRGAPQALYFIALCIGLLLPRVLAHQFFLMRQRLEFAWKGHL